MKNNLESLTRFVENSKHYVVDSKFFVVQSDKFIEYETDCLEDALREAKRLKQKHENLSYCVATVVANVETEGENE